MQNRITVGLFKRIGVEGLLFNLYLSVREVKFYIRAVCRGTFSQHGEDRFILQYFRGKKGTYIDIGANHAFIINNTYLLYKNGWSGITVEPIPYLYRRLMRHRPRDLVLKSAVSNTQGSLTFFNMIPSVLSTFNEEKAGELITQGHILRDRLSIEVITLSQLYQEHLSGREVDVLSIDTEGMDLDVLMGNDWSAMSPKLIICEVSDNIDETITQYLQSKKYKILREFGCNRIYERQI